MTTLSLLTYNVKMLPGPGGTDRARDIVAVLLERNYDLVCLQETFDEDARDVFVRGLRDRYPFMVPKCHDGDIFQEDSGLFFASRHPIRGWGYAEYAECASTDCWADKGILGVRLDLPTKETICIFTTHLQSDEKYASVRESQVHQLRGYISDALRRVSSPGRTGVLLCGDLNVVGDVTEEYRRMISGLGYPVDVYRSVNDADPGYTWDATKNTSMIPPSDGDHQRLDYILAYDYLPMDMTPTAPVMQLTRTSCSIEEFRFSPERHLSDHFGVGASFSFDGAAAGDAPVV